MERVGALLKLVLSPKRMCIKLWFYLSFQVICVWSDDLDGS